MRISVAKRRELAALSWDALVGAFPEASCTLDSDTPERLAIRGILSAQCTDERVNITANDLFGKYPDMSTILDAGYDEIAAIIKPCGLTKGKTLAILDFATKYMYEWGQEVPNDVDKLMTCKGVGKKIANLIVGEIYGTPAMVVDTHCKRVMYRIGITDNTDPLKVEADVCKYFPSEQWIRLGHLAVNLGRTYCVARGAKCDSCPLSEFCCKRV